MIPKFREAGEKAFEIMNPATLEFGAVDDPEEVRVKREEAKSEYVGKFIERILASYPPATSLRRRFYLDWDQYQTSAPEMLLTTADDVLQTTEAQQAAAAEAHRQMAEKINGFVSSVVTSLRTETSVLCTKVATAIKNGKLIRTTTINSLKNQIERFKDMNFVGDQTVQAQLDAVQKDLLDQFPTEQFTSDAELRTQLAARLTEIATEAGKVTDQDVGQVTGQYRRMVNWED